ncbi:MAG: GNAT family N-acetyltransferase [Bacillota bacterium]
MRLLRIRDTGIAAMVSRGVLRFNGVRISPSRVTSLPHYGIFASGQLAGWVGIELRRRGIYELCHLSVLPRYRRHGLAASACKRAIALVRRRGGRYIYARVKRGNHPAIRLMRKLGFQPAKGGRVIYLGRSL